VRGDDVLASLDVADSFSARLKGLLGRDGIEGALFIKPATSVHTLGMKFAIDVAFCDRHGLVLRTVTVPPWRVTRLVWRSGFVVEAAAGSFDRWRLQPGDTIEVRE